MNAHAIGVVLDRATLAKVGPDELRKKLGGGGWSDMITMYDGLPSMPYLAMLAHTPKRIKHQAPLAVFARNDAALREAVRALCGELSGVTCAWMLLVERGSTAEQILTHELLADFVPEGTA